MLGGNTHPTTITLRRRMMSNLFEAIAPTLATALAGPLAGMATGFISKFFNVSPNTIQEVISNADPVKLKELEYAFKQHLEDNQISIQLAQIDVNKTEATSSNLFVSGWRPSVGWVCVFGLIYSFILQPIISWYSTAHGYVSPPALDLSTLITILGGLLGIGTLRTVEKINGVAAK